MSVQSIDFAAIAPPLVVALTALLVLVLDLLLPDARRAVTVASRLLSGCSLHSLPSRRWPTERSARRSASRPMNVPARRR